MQSESSDNFLANYPNVKRAQLRPDGWGSPQIQKDTKPEQNRSDMILFYLSLFILTIVILYKLLLR